METETEMEAETRKGSSEPKNIDLNLKSRDCRGGVSKIKVCLSSF